jgi:putative tricarboxylic transport membrane protein
MKINDAIFGAIFVLLGAVVLVHVQKFPMIPGQQVGPALFPGSIAVGIGICGLLLIASGLRHRASQPWFVAEEWTRSTRHVVAFLAVIVSTVAYIYLADVLGFLIVGPVILLVLFLLFGVRPRLAVIVAIVSAFVIWYAFYKLLRVPLPWGVLTKWAF